MNHLTLEDFDAAVDSAYKQRTYQPTYTVLPLETVRMLRAEEQEGHQVFKFLKQAAKTGLRVGLNHATGGLSDQVIKKIGIAPESIENIAANLRRQVGAVPAFQSVAEVLYGILAIHEMIKAAKADAESTWMKPWLS